MSLKSKYINTFKIVIVCLVLTVCQSCENEPVEITPITDSDGDGIEEGVDNCPFTANPNQEDEDNDGIGNVCDDDFGGDPVPLALCENGFADIYPCKDYDLMARIPINVLASTFTDNLTAPEGSDIWGWTDASTGNEYAIVGTTNSTAFVDVTNPSNPVFLGRVNTETTDSFWRDVKVYNNFAFIVADGVNDHGMQVFDLTRLRNVTNPPQTFTADQVFKDVGSCHNIVINESEAIAYLVGCNTFGGGPNFIDISNPANPTTLGGFASNGYSHDAQVVTYNGPDTEHTGKQIYIGSNGSTRVTNKVVILDVTDKSNPSFIAEVTYPNSQYAHQGWFTEDQRHFILGDELDEIRLGGLTKTLVFDFTDLDNPVLSSTYFGPTAAIDHNGYVKGNKYYLANYRAGMRVLDITNIAAATDAMTEVAFFDTYPSSDSAAFNGAWSVYPYFPSGNIIISDIESGLFIVRPSDL
ncbi:choice-of-anchor B family protein [Changchengzhania lutea]|uniref:choice-of-anchor B family protein n=1 Tax=Changchengzhania lutea TaxID=2049305 RepID=UPI00115DB81F|nr:choice-of-anchor B family protein [Changchengzhania lutea]